MKQPAETDMRWPFLIVLLLAALASWASPPHDFHVCITQIDYSSEKGRLEITLKLFTDDLEGTLEKMGAPKLRIGSGKLEHPLSDSLIHAYLGHRFGLEADGTELKLDWVGKEVEMDATWCYVECPLPSGTKELQVWNRILLERFDDQANIVHFKSAAQTQSLMLDRGEDRGKFAL